MNNPNYYQQRINTAIDYLNRHLEEDIKIETLADVTHFSSFHFQRIYKALMNETPYETLLRLRLEKSLFLIKHRPVLKLSEVAWKSGFSSYENFSRQFKKRYNITPTQFKKDKRLQNSRIYQEKNPEDFYHCIEKSRIENGKEFPVAIENLPAISIAFIRAVFGQDGHGLVNKYLSLVEWAKKYQVPFQGELKRFGMSIDNVDATPVSKFRYDFALSVQNQYPTDDTLIEYGLIPAGKYATLHCKGKLEDVAQAWDYLYRIWLPKSGYQPLHYPAIEEFVQGPEEIGWDNFNIKCRIPIENNQHINSQ